MRRHSPDCRPRDRARIHLGRQTVLIHGQEWLYQHVRESYEADGRANLSAPVVGRAAAGTAVDDLRQRLGAALCEVPREFSIDYPVMYQGGVATRRR